MEYYPKNPVRSFSPRFLMEAVVVVDDDGCDDGSEGAYGGAKKMPWGEMMMVEFPGIVINDVAALETLGGAMGVAAAINTPGAMLPLRLRPHDTQSSAIFGDRVPTKNLILRVVRRRGASAGELIRTELVARVPEAFCFKGMADFQFLDLQNADRRGEDLSGDTLGDDDIHDDVGLLLDEQVCMECHLRMWVTHTLSLSHTLILESVCHTHSHTRTLSHS